jgi:hypothetical protein
LTRARRGPSCCRVLLALALLGAGACDGSKTAYMGAHAPFAGCVTSPTAPPAALGLDPFYAKYLDGFGTPVVSSAAVGDQALAAACRITGEVVALRADVRAALAANRLHVAVLAAGERTTDIPEHADLYSAFPDTDWNTLRSIGATRARPVASTGEENLLCLPGDPYAGETTLVWVLALGLGDLGIVEVDAQFGTRVQSAYDAAMAGGLWAGTKDADHYWATGGQAWFGANSRLPATTREALADYDPPLAALLSAWLPADEWKPGCY